MLNEASFMYKYLVTVLFSCVFFLHLERAMTSAIEDCGSFAFLIYYKFEGMFLKFYSWLFSTCSVVQNLRITYKTIAIIFRISGVIVLDSPKKYLKNWAIYAWFF